MQEHIIGLVAGRPVSERLDLAVEIYHDQANGTPVNDTILDVGGRFKLRRGFVALFMAGRNVGVMASASGFVGYLGVQILLSDYGRGLERKETPVAPRPAR